MMRGENQDLEGSEEWKIVCPDLAIEMSGKSLAELRRDVKPEVDKKGDPKKDYRFAVFQHGEARKEDSFVVTPRAGLDRFSRRRMPWFRR